MEIKLKAIDELNNKIKKLYSDIDNYKKENNLDHLISINKIIYNNYNTNCLNDIKNLNEYIIYKKKA